MPNAGEGAAGEGRRATVAVAAGAAALAAAAALPGAIDLPLWQDEVASARVLLEATPAGVVDTKNWNITGKTRKYAKAAPV